MFFSLKTLILFYTEEPWVPNSQAALPVWRARRGWRRELKHETQTDKQKGNVGQVGGASSTALGLGVHTALRRFWMEHQKAVTTMLHGRF